MKRNADSKKQINVDKYAYSNAQQTALRKNLKTGLCFLSSFVLVLFAQPDLSPLCCILGGSVGYGLFWYALATHASSRKEAFWLSFIWFLCIEGFHFSWLLTDLYVGRSIYLFWFLLIACLATLFACFSLLVVMGITKRWRAILFLLPGVWVAAEIGRFYYFLSGISLDYIGWPLAATAYGRQFGSFFGWAGCSFMVVASGVSLVAALCYKKNALYALWIACACVPYLLGGGYYEYLKHTLKPEKELRVAIVQPASPLSVEQGGKHSAMALWKHFVQLLTEVKEPIDLLVFPEVAVPFAGPRQIYDFQETREALLPLLDLSCQENKLSNFDWMYILACYFQCPVLLGLERWEYTQGRHYLYNAAECITPQGGYCGYDKRILVPGGEYIPCGSLGLWVCSMFFPKNAFNTGRIPGTRSGVLIAPNVPNMGISICYEETFGALLRSYKKDHAELLINMTNDGWYPRSRLPAVHFYHGMLRNQELGLPCLRSCHTGVTAVVDSLGRVIAMLPYDSHKHQAPPGILQATIPIATYTTPYCLWGDVPMFFIAFLSLGGLGGLLLVYKKKEPFHL